MLCDEFKNDFCKHICISWLTKRTALNKKQIFQIQHVLSITATIIENWPCLAQECKIIVKSPVDSAYESFDILNHRLTGLVVYNVSISIVCPPRRFKA